MEDFAAEGKTVGIIIDVSLRHDKQGRRLIDSIKKALISVVRELVEDDVDLLYLYHPQLVDCMSRHGDQFCAIGNYETDGWAFNLPIALKQTMYVMASSDIHDRKYVIYVTDRLHDRAPLDKAFHVNQKDMLDCHFYVVGIGDHYNRTLVRQVTEDQPATYLHLDHPSELTPSLFKEYANGAENARSSSHE